MARTVVPRAPRVRTREEERRQAVLRWLRGETAEEVARVAGVGPGTLARWRQEYLRSKLPLGGETREETVGLVRAPVRIRRDRWGIPHVRAESEADAFFGLGYAMAQERLWQLDYQRRFVRGQLAALFGRRFLASDRTMRVLGFGASADRAWAAEPDDVRVALEALAAGINRWTEAVGSKLPVEFEILDYEPTPWQPADSIAIWQHRWWTNCGRLELILVADAARHLLPAELLDAFLTSELADETIVPEAGGAPAPGPGSGLDEGSNNWAVGVARTTTGAPILCSDPHNVFNAPSQWVEAQVTSPSFDAAGAFYLGTPGLYLGRNRDVAWGLTNHLVSVRDLYREETSPDRPSAYRDGDAWVPFAVERQPIEVKGEPAEELTIRFTTRGPVVNELLAPHGVDETPPLSMRWVGAEADSGFASSLGLIRARSAADVLAALHRWPCPPLNYVYADRAGAIGYHVAGHVPRRARPGLFVRDANDPADAWEGFLDFDELPRVENPARGWVATANNVPWHRDPGYVESGAWSDGYRARRIRLRLTAKERLAPEEVAAVQGDTVSGRAVDLVPALLKHVAPGQTEQERAAIRALMRWNGDQTLESVGASVWTAFWVEWTRDLARARFPAPLAEAAALRLGNVARQLLLGDTLPWLAEDPVAAIRRAFAAALATLERVAGPDVAGWRWGRLHRLTHPHPLAITPDLAALFNTGPYPTTGGQSVRAAGFNLGVPFPVTSGSTYRFMADLSRPDRLISVQTLGQSAHPASPHYRDQTRLWLENRYHPFWMDDADVQAQLESETTIAPP